MDIHFHIRISNGRDKTMTKRAHTSTSHHANYKTYTSGFILSVILTVMAFYFVSAELFSGWTLAISLSILAVAQLLIQLLFFLHLGREDKPRWNLIAFLFMILVILIVVVGSLWIMHNLNYNMIGDDVKTEIMNEENIYR